MTIARLARRQLDDLRALTPGTMFGDGDPGLAIDEAYALQDAVAALRRLDGEEPAGYKVGCTGRNIRRIFGVDGPIRGIVWRDEVHRTGAVLSACLYANLSIEGELAVTIGPNGGPDRIFPVVELHHYVLRSDPPRLQELIANNGLQAGLVVEEQSVGWRRRPAAGRLRVFVNGRLCDEGDMYGVPGGIEGSLQWITEHLAERDVEPEPGMIISCGTPLGIHPVSAGDEVRVEADGLGAVGAVIGP